MPESCPCLAFNITGKINNSANEKNEPPTQCPRYNNEIDNPTGKYKDPIEFQNAIIKSQMVDGDLTAADARALLGRITKPTEIGVNYRQMGVKYINATALSRIKKDEIIFKLNEDIEAGKVEDKQMYDHAVDLTAVVAGREADEWYTTIAGQIEKERGKVIEARERVEEAFRVGKVGVERITAINPKTGKRIYSGDNGKTWRDIKTNKVIK